MIPAQEAGGESAMMGRRDRDQEQLFYEFSLDEMITTDHVLRGSTCLRRRFWPIYATS
jgi:hypothetical protein